MATTTLPNRNLLSADTLAFGVGVAALFAHYFYPPLLILVAAAVFAPSVLREIGVLHDADEWTQKIMYRAGFHALLASGFLIFLAYAAPLFSPEVPRGGTSAQDILTGETLRKAVVWVFLLSYLLQYWGAHLGAQRVFWGVALMTLAPAGGFLRRGGDAATLGTLISISMAVVFLLLALTVRRWPRAGGWLLLALCATGLVFAAFEARDPIFAWSFVGIMFQVVLIFGVTGLALLRENPEPV